MSHKADVGQETLAHQAVATSEVEVLPRFRLGWFVLTLALAAAIVGVILFGLALLSISPATR